jgi:hypothetical protein
MNELIKSKYPSSLGKYPKALFPDKNPNLRHELRIALIDDYCLSRESLAYAALIVQPTLIIIPFQSVVEFTRNRGCSFDLIVYADHGYSSAGLEELLMVMRAERSQGFIIISYRASSDILHLLKQFRTSSAMVISAQETNLAELISSFCVVKDGLENSSINRRGTRFSIIS